MRIKCLLGILFIFVVGCNSQANHGDQATPHKVTWEHDGLFTDSYTIYCGQATGAYTQNVVVGNLLREYPLSQLDLSDGTNYCAMTANNFAGASVMSNEIAFGTLGGDLIMTPPAPVGNFSVI